MIWGRVQVRNHCLSHCPPLSHVCLPFKAFSLLIPVTFCRIAKRVLPKHNWPKRFLLYIWSFGERFGPVCIRTAVKTAVKMAQLIHWFNRATVAAKAAKFMRYFIIVLQTSQRKHLEIFIVIISYSSFLKAMRYFLCCTLLIIMHRSAGLAYSSFAVPLRSAG